MFVQYMELYGLQILLTRNYVSSVRWSISHILDDRVCVKELEGSSINSG